MLGGLHGQHVRIPRTRPTFTPVNLRRLPSVVDYYGAFHDDAHLYIIMEYCGGGDLLEKLLRDKKAMNEKKVAIEVAYPCLSILKTLHEMRIIHRWGAGGWWDGQGGTAVC